mmetsp:Transcript_21686/g.63760  ORF Transcript_21686/g.63760 Transcript_21686/m.63760 type:complete len:302 (+) Transcript_21686:380-1285(+)
MRHDRKRGGGGVQSHRRGSFHDPRGNAVEVPPVHRIGLGRSSVDARIGHGLLDGTRQCRFDRRRESSPHGDAVGPQGEGGRQSSPVGESPRRDEGNVGEPRRQGRDENEGRRVSPVRRGLVSRRQEGVGSRFDRAPGVTGVRHGGEDFSSVRMSRVGDIVGPPKADVDQGDAFLQGDGGVLPRSGHEEGGSHAEGPAGLQQFAYPTYGRSSFAFVQRSRGEYSRPARVGYRRHQFRLGDPRHSREEEGVFASQHRRYAGFHRRRRGDGDGTGLVGGGGGGGSERCHDGDRCSRMVRCLCAK